jgi:hypothetical protein
MALDTAPFIGGLDPNLPTNLDPRAEGAGQIRAVKAALTKTFPNINSEVKLSSDDFNTLNIHRFQVGMIMNFSGDKAPDNWAICDSERVVNGVVVPDLKDRFIKGWNPDNGEKIGTTGGSAEEKDFAQFIISGGTTLTKAQLPKVTEDFWGAWDNGDNSGGEAYLTGADSGGRDGRKFTKTTLDGGNQPHIHPLKAVEGRVFDKRPPWYALSYIMFVGAPLE